MLLIFDWDGTLSDSTSLITRAMQQSAQDLGWAVPEEHAVHNIIGLGLPEALAMLFPAVDDEGRRQVRDRYRENYLLQDRIKAPQLFPEVMEGLTRLRDDGHRLAVATSKSRAGLDRVLEAMKLRGFFEATRCADETASKPHPLMLEQLLEVLGGSPSEAVMIGDTEYDMEMGRRAGMDRIAVSYGAHELHRLHPYAPALCLDRFGELLAWERLIQV
ncbi:HAD family hydrolase [Marinimicrobium sp. ARAG 43.8]|uniref:HAD family hydrolase n=1 Tax=Marinimicrobium sp. ARAG 43.8 TaxID=3418719 RepID=UPI003CEB331E